MSKEYKKRQTGMKGTGKSTKTVSLIKDYLWEKRAVVCLFLFISLIFLVVGSLYHLENLPKLLYAALLSGFCLLAAGVTDGLRYVRKRRAVAGAMAHPEQAADFFAEEEPDFILPGTADGGSMPGGQKLEMAYRKLVGTLCEENRRLYSRAEEKRTEQSNYYVMWAHQIKTPIAAMRLLLNGTSADRLAKAGTGGQKENFLLQEELFKIEQYVDMALHYQRLESMAADLVLQKYDLYSMIKQAVKKYSVLFINRSLSLKLEELQLSVVTDEKWFCFCVEQILSNSIKYTTRGSISLYQDHGSDGDVKEQDRPVLVIEDTGIGIRAEDIPRIFERGFTGYNGRMDKKSTGIGLYLTKQVLDKLGIGIRVESREGEGTKVFLTLVTENEKAKLTKM